MEHVADVAFGLETVTVAGAQKALDVCGLADELYDAMNGVPEGTEALKETILAGKAAAAVFAKYGFPEITIPAAAYKFAAQVCMRALDLKKEVGDVWRTSEGPTSPSGSPDSTSSD